MLIYLFIRAIIISVGFAKTCLLKRHHIGELQFRQFIFRHEKWKHSCLNSEHWNLQRADYLVGNCWNSTLSDLKTLLFCQAYISSHGDWVNVGKGKSYNVIIPKSQISQRKCKLQTKSIDLVMVTGHECNTTCCHYWFLFLLISTRDTWSKIASSWTELFTSICLLW